MARRIVLVLEEDPAAAEFLTRLVARCCRMAWLYDGAGEEAGTLVAKLTLDPAMAAQALPQPTGVELLEVEQVVEDRPVRVLVNLGAAPASRDAAVAEKLTPRQREVLRQLELGLSNKEIARVLELSEWTVRRHVSAILARLEVSTRGKAARLVAGGG